MKFLTQAILFSLCYAVLGEVPGPSSQDTLNSAPITVSALSRVAKLGELYDARTEQFLGISLLPQNLDNKSFTTTQNSQTKMTFSYSDSLKEKFLSMDISASLQLSILSGIVSLEGSARYFRDTKTSTKSAKATLINTFSTKTDQISLTDKEVKPLLNMDVLSKIDATHVVFGIQWGGSVFVSVEDLNQNSEERQKVEGSLKATVNLIAVKLSGGGQAKLTDEEKNKVNNYKFEMYGDLLPEDVPETTLEALQFMKTAPGKVIKANNGKGKALKYTLLPLNTLKKLLELSIKVNALVNEIDESTVKMCVKFFDEINQFSLKLNDLVDEAKSHSPYISTGKIEQVQQIQDDFEMFSLEIKKNLSEQLILVRSGNKSAAELNDLIKEAVKKPNSHKNINLNIFSKLRRDISHIEILKSLNVTMINKDSSLAYFLSKYYHNHSYIFFYDHFDEKDLALRTFRDLIDNKKSLGEKAILAAVNKEIYNETNNYYTDDISSNRIDLYINASLVVEHFEINDNIRKGIHPSLWGYFELQENTMMKDEIENVEKVLSNDIKALKVETNELAKKSNTLINDVLRLQDTIKGIQIISGNNASAFATDIEKIRNNITSLEKNPVPIGFVYVQLPYEPEPKSIWPNVNWEDVSTKYKDLFFRVKGDNTADWGNVQEQSSPRITKLNLEHHGNEHLNFDHLENASDDLTIGNWGKPIHTGDIVTAGSDYIGMKLLKFYTSDNEVRPKNIAVRIWKRV